MFLNSKSDEFKVEFPRVFIPDHIKAKYAPYLHRLPTAINDVSDLVNYSIQSINIPSTSYEPITQTQAKTSRQDPDARGFNRTHRAVGGTKSLQSKEFTVTFKMVNGYLNYWVMQETFWYHYAHQNKVTYMCDLPVKILDSDSVQMFTAKYTGVLFTGLGEFELSYANNIREFKTFDCNFVYNEFVTSLDID
jgi:hypothetical protein